MQQQLPICSQIFDIELVHSPLSARRLFFLAARAVAAGFFAFFEIIIFFSIFIFGEFSLKLREQKKVQNKYFL